MPTKKKKKRSTNYEKVRNKIVHIKEYECQTCFSRSTEPILCCRKRMIHTHKRGHDELKGCC